MKILFPFLIASIFIINLAKSQTFDFYTAKEGLNYLISSVEGLETEAELIAIQAFGIPESEMNIDFENGKATIWLYIFKSSETSNKTTYYYYLFKSGDQWAYEKDEDQNPDLPASLSKNWIDSDQLSLEVKKNNFLNNFKEDNKDFIMQEIIMLYKNKETNLDSWNIGFVLYDKSFAYCTYNAENLSLVGCESPTSVNEIISKATFLYPNPANNFTNIELPFSGLINLNLYNIHGEIVMQISNNTDGKFQINTSNLPVGVYNAVITGSDNIISKRIIISR